MEYGLAKLLEAAGWPQAGRGSWVGDPESLVLRHRVYAPLLEELIDASVRGSLNCGAVNPARGLLLRKSQSGQGKVIAQRRLWRDCG